MCLRGSGLRVAKALEVKRAGGSAIILGNPLAYANEVPVDALLLPGTAVSANGTIAILNYINSSRRPTATIGRAHTVLDVRPSPVMAQFSSRGPNVLEPNLLKVTMITSRQNILIETF